jgi:hypothetical protein
MLGSAPTVPGLAGRTPVEEMKTARTNLKGYAETSYNNGGSQTRLSLLWWEARRKVFLGTNLPWQES